MTVIDLYNRDFAITVGGIPLTMQTGDILQPDNIDTQLRVVFNIDKNSDKSPNKAEVTVFNFNLANRATLKTGNQIAQETRATGLAYDWPLVIEAGYMGSREVLFTGNITYATSKKESTDWVTNIECGDGETKFRENRINKAFGPGTTVAQVALECSTALDVGPGNIGEKLGTGIFRDGYGVFSQGYVASGASQEILDDLLSSAGFTWSIQDGNLQILAPEDTTFEEIVVLSKEFGLVGSPEVGDKGIVTAKSLLQGKIRPGRRIIIQSEMVSGTFKIDKVSHYGDTFGSDWYTELEAKPL
jgi:hypothetical protein